MCMCVLGSTSGKSLNTGLSSTHRFRRFITHRRRARSTSTSVLNIIWVLIRLSWRNHLRLFLEHIHFTEQSDWNRESVRVSAANKFSCVTDYKLDPLQNQTCKRKRHTDTYIRLRKNQLSLLCALHINTLSHRQTSPTTHIALDTYQHAPTQLTRIHCITNTRRQKERMEKS